MNQNATYRFEVPGGFLWSPKTKANGHRNYYYDSMAEVQPGDVVFSFSDTYIKAIGIVQRPAVTAPKPDFRTAGSNWSDTGWFVEVEFAPIEAPFQPRDFMDVIRPLLATKYAPLRANGDGLQNLYLTEISAEFGQLLMQLSNTNIPVLEAQFTPVGASDDDVAVEAEIQAKHLEGDLEGIQLVKARRGQGVFKANVRMIERACRITGVTEIKHLRASHIKPWSVSSNDEKLDGHNGLLLSPHVDHLFDRGFISFSDRGDVLVSRELRTNILGKWSIDPRESVGAFNMHQMKYLDYHRDAVFRR